MRDPPRFNKNALKNYELWDWQWPYQCTECNKVIYSKTEGDFTICDCAGVDRQYVDQTRYYMRGTMRLRRLEREEVEKLGFTIKEFRE